jgi:hypothetical protein
MSRHTTRMLLLPPQLGKRQAMLLPGRSVAQLAHLPMHRHPLQLWAAFASPFGILRPETCLPRACGRLPSLPQRTRHGQRQHTGLLRL